MRLTTEQVQQAREWVAECVWMETMEDLQQLPDVAIERGIAKHYDGGIDQFICDCQPAGGPHS